MVATAVEMTVRGDEVASGRMAHVRAVLTSDNLLEL
jgi:hypothetical protein